MVDVVRNVLVQLGEPARWESLGDGLTATTQPGGELLTAGGANAQRCALTRSLSGSWIAAVEVVTTVAGAAAFAVGVVPVAGRQTLAQRRPVNELRPQDWNLNTIGQQAIIIDRNGRIRVDGTTLTTIAPAPVAGSTIYMIHDASARTLTFRVNNPSVGGYTVTGVDGPLRIAANCNAASTSLRLVHDIETLPRMPGYRPAGVWGRVGMMSATDVTHGVVWDGRLASDGDPAFQMSAGFAVMSNATRRGAAVGDITVINTPDMPGQQRRALDDWLEWHVRDEPVTILRGELGKDPGTYTVVAQGVVDSISEPREGRLAVSCRDKSALLDIPWQAETYPDSTPLVSLRGRSKPTVAGSCRAVPLVMTDAAQLLYDVTDDAWASAPSLVYDRGVQLTSGVGYSVSIDGKTLQRLTNPDGLQCATVTAGTLDTSVAIGATVGDFVQWAGSPTAPRGWTNQSTGTGTSVTNTANGARFVRGSSGQATLITGDVLPAPTGFFRVDLDIAAHVSGTLLVLIETSGGTPFAFHSVTLGSGTGLRSFWFSKPLNFTRLRFRVDGAPGDITVRSIRIAGRVNISSIADHVLHAASYRGPLPESDIDVASFSFPDAASMPLCLHTGPGDNRTVLRVLDHLLASVGGGWYFDALGKLRGVLLEDPEDVATRWQANGWPIVQLDDVNLIGDVSSRLDEAGGLTTRVAGDPTWAVHSPSDIASSLYTSSAGRTLADTLMADYAAIATGTTTVAADYRHAEQAEPFGSLLSTSAGAQLLANRLTALYRKRRRLVTVRAALDDSLALQPGHPVLLTHAGASRHYLCLSNRGRFSNDTADLILWG